MPESHQSVHDRDKQNWKKNLSKVRKTEEMLFPRVVAAAALFKVCKVYI